MEQPKAYLIGGGLASLATAAYLIRDGDIPGERIHIFEESEIFGGSLDSPGLSWEEGYTTRGHRMFEEKVYTCTFDLLSFIPSLDDPEQTVTDEILEFNRKYKSHCHSRLIENGTKVDAWSLGLSWKDRFNMVKLILLRSESSLGNLRIKDYFSPSFFETNFWIEFCTVFAFQAWHSLVEFRRYFLRFIHDIPIIHTLETCRSTPYNQYESIILPLLKWLKEQGVQAQANKKITNIKYRQSKDTKTVERIDYVYEEKPNEILVNENDYVFITLGSMVTNSSMGSMSSAPRLASEQSSASWDLWETISRDQPDFGKPSVFKSNIKESQFWYFTVTFRNRTFFELMKSFTGSDGATDAGMAFRNSNWLMSIILPHQPHFMSQPDHVTVCCGCGLFPDNKGNYVEKKMSECNGEEILSEVCFHLGFMKELPSILDSATCIPCALPYSISQFSPRAKGDRPPVIPQGSTNFAFIGQFCEMPDDIVFTTEYSVRSAQTGVYSLLKLDKKVTPIYKGHRDPRIVYNAIKTLFR